MLWLWQEEPKETEGSKWKVVTDHLAPVLVDHGLSHIPDGKKPQVMGYRYLKYYSGKLPQNPSIGASDVILAMGSAPLQELKNHGLIKKNLTIGSSSKQIYTIPTLGAKCLTTYSASIRNVDYSLFTELLCDISLAVRVLKTGSLVPPMLDFQWCHAPTGLVKPLKEIELLKATGKVAVAIDLETTGLIAYSVPKNATWIITFQISTNTTSSHVVKFDQDTQPTKPKGDTPSNYAELLWVQINQILNDPMVKLRGANLKYDLMWIAEKWGMECTNFTMDTLLVGSLLDENRSNSLKTHAYMYTIYGGYEQDLFKKYDIARVQDVPPDVLLPYCGYDTTVCLEASNAMAEALQKDVKLAYFYKEILHPAARAYEAVEREGVLVDVPYYESFKADLVSSLEALDKEGNAFIKSLVRGTKKEPKYDGQSILNKFAKNPSLTRAAMLGELFFSTRGLNLTAKMYTPKPDKDGNKKPSTAIEHFLKFKDEPKAAPFVTILEKYKDIEKTLGTYVDGFLKHKQYDNRFHGTYFLFKGGDDDNGTNSGRVSVINPALQCLVGTCLITTSLGEISIEDIVNRHEKGESFKVITHNGVWRDVIGSYRNGVQPILKISTASGLFLKCTANHPWLTSGGFIQAGKLAINDQVWRLPNAQEKRDTPRNCLPQTNSYAGSRTTVNKAAISLSVPVRRTDNSTYVTLNSWSDKVLWLFTSGTKNYSWAHFTGLSITNVPLIPKYATALLQPESTILQRLRWSWDNCLSGMERFFSNVSNGYGGETRRFNFGTVGCKSGLFTSQLQMGYALRTEQKYAKQRVAGNEWGTQNSAGLGETVRDKLAYLDSTVIQRVEPDSGTHHSSEAEEALYQKDYITSIEFMPSEETYDLTIDKCHSFIANGIVVHNTVPKNTRWSKKLRRAFIAPEGFIVANIDYSQGELRIAADLADEPTMLDAYNNGIDLHCVTGASLADIDLATFMSYKKHEDKEAQEIFKVNRQKAKGANFGLLYGMGTKGFQAYADTAYGVKMTEAEAGEAREKFFNTYERLLPWHAECRAEAKKFKQVRSPLGRLRHLPLIDSPDDIARSKEERRAINAPVQGTLSDMSLWATSIMHREGYTKEAPVILMVHDALMFYLPLNNWKFFAKKYMEIMSNLPFEKFGWEPKLKFDVDIELSFGNSEMPPNFADMHSLDELNLSLD